MSDTSEQLRQQLQTAQRALDEAQARCERHDAEHQAATKELEDNRSALLFMLEDLENARKKIEQAHQEWMAALDVVDDPIFLHDKQFHILRCNKAYQQRAGISFKEIIGQPYYEIFPKSDSPLPCCLRAMEKAEGAEEAEEAEDVAVGEAVYRSRAFSVKDEQGVHLYSVHILEDFTESRRAEAALHESEERFRKIAESAQDSIIMMGADQRISFWNVAAERIFGYTAAEAIGQELHPLITPPAAHVAFAQGFPYFQATGEGPVIGKPVEVTALRKSGEEFPVELSISAMQLNGQWHAIAIVRDITERKRAEDDLRFRSQLLDSASDTIFVVDFNGNFVYLNEAAWKTRGYTYDEMMVMNLHVLDTPKYEKLIESRMRDLMENGQFVFESEQRCKDGSVMQVEINSHLIKSGGRKLVLSVIRDISERKQAEAEIRNANRALATLSAVNRTLVHASSEDELLQSICQAIVQQRGYQMAWVGYAQHEEAKSIKVMAHADGDDKGCLEVMQLTWAEGELGMRSIGNAIRSGVTQVSQDIANDPHYLQWREAMLKCGIASGITLPLLNKDKVVFGVLTVYAAEVNAFTSNEIELLVQMAGDLAFGVHTLHIRHERDLALVKNQEQLAQLQDSLEDTVRAIATIVEMRDPYTAGHQVRVADLAVAIAKQMGLPDEQVHAIHLAGMVHDLGKINIPAEILSKPGKISDIEYSLIKSHPQSGYDILNDIDFPWPIAQMVLQHHERLDGSGYPQGLKGDAILLEARILSVADIVEAMSSHRPYRPGLGIEAALDEITRARGTLYDPQVVDACIALFREQKYVLPE